MNYPIKIFAFDNSYARLPEGFYHKLLPAKAQAPKLIAFNAKLAKELGVDFEEVSNEQIAGIFSGNIIPDGAEPLAMAYAGHQFGHFVPRLGDGRAILLGEVIDKKGVRRDIQLKGSGLTPFSRSADGKAAIGPVIREYIVSEAMHALGIKTTRSLAAVATGEPVYRETVLPGAVLTRIAASHVRIGTFEYFAARRDYEAVKTLADHVITRYYPKANDASNPYSALLESLIDAQAKLVATWMCVGFIHGVMNTDNMSISGETIDYGPCAFMDEYNPLTVFSSIDIYGRYAFARQPQIAQWNLARFAETLLTFIEVEEAEKLVVSFQPRFQQYWLTGMRRKIGLFTQEDGDSLLIENLLKEMHDNGLDHTNSFRSLSDGSDIKISKQWQENWRDKLKRQTQPFGESLELMRSVNPVYIPRNHLVQQAISASENGNYRVMEELMGVLQNPYERGEGLEQYEKPPLDSQRVLRTFCGT